VSAPVTLDADDALELVEVLDLLRRWFDRDRARLDASLARHTGWGMSLGAVRDDLSRFIDNLGGCQW
jgi:hypothetical protein